jgi:F-type H+-transporting ATPase subunit b
VIAELFHDPEVAVAIAFVIALAVVARKVWATITAALDTRAARIKAQLDEARTLREEAQQALAQIQRRQRDALQEAEAIIAHAREEAARYAEKAKQDLEAALQRRERLAQERIALAESKAVDEVKGAAVDVAIDAARRIIADNLGETQGNALIERAIEDLPARIN